MMKKFITILLVCLALFGLTSTSYAAAWQWITSTDTIGFYFDKASIRKSSAPGKYLVWTKQDLTESEGIRQSKNLNFPKAIDYILLRYEFNYKNESSKPLAVVYYAKDGTALRNITNEFAQAEAIIPGSIIEAFFYTTLDEYQKQFGGI